MCVVLLLTFKLLGVGRRWQVDSEQQQKDAGERHDRGDVSTQNRSPTALTQRLSGLRCAEKEKKENNSENCSNVYFVVTKSNSLVRTKLQYIQLHAAAARYVAQY